MKSSIFLVVISLALLSAVAVPPPQGLTDEPGAFALATPMTVVTSTTYEAPENSRLKEFKITWSSDSKVTISMYKGAAGIVVFETGLDGSMTWSAKSLKEDMRGGLHKVALTNRAGEGPFEVALPPLTN